VISSYGNLKSRWGKRMTTKVGARRQEIVLDTYTYPSFPRPWLVRFIIDCKFHISFHFWATRHKSAAGCRVTGCRLREPL